MKKFIFKIICFFFYADAEYIQRLERQNQMYVDFNDKLLESNKEYSKHFDIMREMYLATKKENEEILARNK